MAQREINFKISATDAGASSTMDRVKKALDNLKENAGRGSPLREVAEVLKGAGVIGGLTELGSLSAEWAKRVRDANDAFLDGKKSAGSIVEEMAKGLPILGGFISAGRDIQEIFTGEERAAKLIREEMERGQKVFERQRDTAKEIRDFLRGIGQGVSEAGIKADSAEGVNPGGDNAMSAAQQRKNIEESFRVQIEKVRGTYQDLVTQAGEDAGAARKSQPSGLWGAAKAGIGAMLLRKTPEQMIHDVQQDFGAGDRAQARVDELRGQGSAKISALEKARDKALGELAQSQSRAGFAGRSSAAFNDVGGPLEHLDLQSPLLTGDNVQEAHQKSIDNLEHRNSVQAQLNNERIKDLEDEVKAGKVGADLALRHAKSVVGFEARREELEKIIHDSLVTSAERARAQQEQKALPFLQQRSELLDKLSLIDIGPRQLATSGGRGGAGRFSSGDLALASARNVQSDKLAEIVKGLADINKKLDNPIQLQIAGK